MQTINIASKKTYKIFIDDGLIKYAHKEIKKIIKSKRIVIISDSTVEKLYLKNLKEGLLEEGFDVFDFIFKAGEASKSLDTVFKIYNFLCENNINKSDYLIALGGGTVGDLTGFVASTFLRGLNYINIPTTLLSQVDSCVGGKTGVNLSFGKNLVGTIYPPKAVYIDPKVLKTLNKNQISDGLAEVIKYSIIKSKNLFLTLENGFDENIFNNLIYECLKIKKDIVEADEFERDKRMLLNFGHTLGHAIEKYYDFKKYSHGQAVSMGMLYICYICEKSGFISLGTYKRIENILKKYNLLFYEPLDVNKLIEISLKDKKIRDDHINLVLIKGIGKGFIKKISLEKFKKITLGEDVL